MLAEAFLKLFGLDPELLAQGKDLAVNIHGDEPPPVALRQKEPALNSHNSLFTPLAAGRNVLLMSVDPQTALKDKNRKVGLAVLGVVCLMGGLAYASVPLYALFCRVTGYGGTPQVAQALPDRILDRAVTVRFDSNVSDTLDWDFKPELKTVKVRLGERGVIAYLARNNAAAAETGTAVYNVSPPKAGPYFNKIQCFCFGEQVLQAGEEAHMPVLFYIDPAMDDDPNLKDVTEITLSYTFFKTESSALEEAMEAFYNSDSGAISTTDF